MVLVSKWLCTSMPVLRDVSASAWVPKPIVMRPSAKPVPVRVSDPSLKGLPAVMPALPSVGTTCSSTPAWSRWRRTMPVVALSGTTTVRLLPSGATETGVTLTVPASPPSSRRVKITCSPCTSPTPCSVMVCRVFAEATPACAGVPSAALAMMPDRRESPAAILSTVST
jgi:hypothetical protein